MGPPSHACLRVAAACAGGSLPYARPTVCGTGRPCTVCVSNYTKDGTRFRNHLSLHPLADTITGLVQHVIGVLSDADATSAAAARIVRGATAAAAQIVRGPSRVRAAAAAARIVRGEQRDRSTDRRSRGGDRASTNRSRQSRRGRVARRSRGVVFDFRAG